jgi:1D-myo-inositol 3-kinase
VNKTNTIMMSQDDTSKGHILVVGHVTRDIFEDRQQLGGGATYAARAASAFGCRISLVTASPASSLLKPLQDDTHITLHRKKCHEFTTFILNHCGGRRELSLVSRAPDLTPEDIPEAARKIPLAYIAPVIGECGRAIIDSLDSMKIVIGAQGWLRQVNDRGVIVPHLLPEAKILPDVHVIIFSEQDFPNAESIASRFSHSVEVVALTRGAKGVTLLSEGEKIELPAAQICKEIDSTGAGDVFGVIFGVELHAGKDIVDAARIAMWAAARVVEGPGMGNLSPDLASQHRRPKPVLL